MASFNKIVIVGYLGRDPEIRYLPDGTAVCHFSVATTEKKKDRSGESQDITTWFKINIWGRQAEVASQYLSKGKQVYVEGRLTQQEYTDRDGNRRTSLEVRATDFQFLGTRGDESSFSGAGAGSSSQSSNPRPSPDSAPGAGDDSENIPF